MGSEEIVSNYTSYILFPIQDEPVCLTPPPQLELENRKRHYTHLTRCDLTHVVKNLREIFLSSFLLNAR